MASVLMSSFRFSVYGTFLNSDGKRRFNDDVLSRCKEGDLLEFYRISYSHWGVYVGDEMVIHRTEDNGTVKVKEDWFWSVVGNSLVEINNRLDSWFMGWAPLPRKKIVKRARSKLGEVGYSTMMNNCEHFATWCRYGVAQSDQVNDAIMAGSVSTALTTTGLLTGAGPLVGVGVALGTLLTTTSIGSKMSYN
ncbi:phospholipase A and acyltransferase 3-like [Branchiostoma lanceolatum]|uniref:phospholipase A and acyltransferase 3-like n=1 Tax=Branchiostoma lanceolatum TaxID=7740 RepID=UPI003452AEFD